ncbi:hypothetical protein D3C87_1172490 [compost metagenome]
MHPAQRGLFSTADLTDLFQLRVAEGIGRMAQAAHQCRAFPAPWILRFADPGTLTVVSQSRCIGIEPLRMADALLPANRVVQHLEVLIVQAQNSPAVMQVNTLSIRLCIRRQNHVGSLIRAEIRVPQACLTVCQLHRFQAFEKRREFRSRHITDCATRRKCAQLDDAFQHTDGLLTGLCQATFGQVDNALDHLIGQLISGVRQHQLAHAGHQRRDHQQCGVEYVREHFFQVIPPGPAGHAVGVLGGNRDVPCVVEHLVDFLPVEVTP